ncbi:hypothetical protein ZWY2020_014216 [Hordeum vulgare]|uniref:TF-B3 domain-containing protein n=1 Tax=Hordeum vulgare subsp. vulgare TaxID=112509 RepID=A0A8I6YHT5_HORVV|nr:hypothetical protein ZWY2020_014216 [Hordeum vulgare]
MYCSRGRIDPAEEGQVMGGLGVRDASWALFKVLEQSDVQVGQNRLLLTKEAVWGGPIPKLFPELEELRGDGLNAENRVAVKILDADGCEGDANFRYLNSSKAYRVMGPQWSRLVKETGMCKGDRLDLYAATATAASSCSGARAAVAPAIPPGAIVKAAGF